MRTKSCLTALAASLLLANCQTSDNLASESAVFETPADKRAGWRLTFSDNFNGRANTQPDPEKWQSENYNRRDNPNGPDGWWDPANVRLDGEGNLILSVTQIPNQNRDNDPYDFAAGMVSTKGLFEQRYGRFEMRGRLPRETGWWAAFWLFSKDAAKPGKQGRDGTEIDILEGFGKSNTVVHALHWDNASKTPGTLDKVANWPGLQAGFHTYALEWSPKEYVFFIDGIESWRTDAGRVSRVPAYIKLTGEISTLASAVSKEWAGPIKPSVFPDEFVIDYVKVWSR